MPSIDLHAMTVGTAQYGADVTRPGMKYAAIARPYVWGGKVTRGGRQRARCRCRAWSASSACPIPPMPSGHNPLGGVAVIANSTWAAMQGRDALRITWDNGPNATYESAAYKAELQASVQQPGAAGRSVGDVAAALAAAPRTVAHEYYVPHLSHAPMEPLVALAEFRDGDGGAVGAHAVAAGRRQPGRELPQAGALAGHGERDAARRRLRPEVEARLPVRGRVPGARGGRPRARAVDARGRHAARLPAHGGRAQAGGRPRCERQGHRVAAPLGVSVHLGHLRAGRDGPQRGGAHQRRQRHSVRHSRTSAWKRAPPSRTRASAGTAR